MGAVPPRLFATGFVVDRPEEGTLFPAVGGNSGNPKVQAIYWRCLVALFASARIYNPGQRLALFCNVSPPRINGIEIAEVLARYGVEVRLVPLTARLPIGLTTHWGNVLYFFDILTSLGNEPAELRLALVDSDVLVTASLAPLFALLDGADYAGYVVDSTVDENINGLSRREMTAIAASLTECADSGPIDHYGGELFLTTLKAFQRDRKVFLRLLDGANTSTGPAARIRTEEHIFSIAFSMLRPEIASAAGLIKRIWTSRSFNTAKPGDEALALWHLPAEKRYGLRDLFFWLEAEGFPIMMDSQAFRAKAMELCGVPRKSFAKLVRDGARQIAARLHSQ